jgi:hypothetical protein
MKAMHPSHVMVIWFRRCDRNGKNAKNRPAGPPPANAPAAA